MVKELGWYIGDKRFTNLYQELKGSVESYAESKAGNASAEEQSTLRESARALFEEHCVRSGLREKDSSYINIDGEFFDGDAVNEEALGIFIKNIVKGHCYQKHLWMWMGTTGNFTVISKGEMRNQGKKYEDYLPIAYKESHPEKKPLDGKLPANTVPIYMYSDGTVSMDYDAEKAKVRFDALQDKSGMNWKKGYDPNDTVKKDGWYGAFNADGVWEKVKTQETVNHEQLAKKSVSEIKIIKHGDTAILYDPGMMLLSAESLLYLTEAGEEYGNLERDIPQTVEAIRVELASLGVKTISAIGVRDNQDEHVLKRYQEVLKKIASSSLRIMDVREVDAIIEEQKDTEKKRAEERIGVEMESVIRSVSVMGMGNRERDVSRALSEGIVTVPLQVMNAKDGESLGLSEEEIHQINKQEVSEEHKQEYATALSNLYAGWGAFAGSGVSKIELAEKIREYYEQGKKLPNEIITAETSLASLLANPIEKDENGIHLFVPNVPGTYEPEEDIDLYNEATREKYLKKLEKGKVLPKGSSAIASTTIQELLPKDASGSVKEKINRSVMRGLKEYQAISMSTGMTIREVIEAAIASATNAAMSASQSSVLKKKISYELALENVIGSAETENYQRREGSVEPLLRGMERRDAPSVVIGGSKGTPLSKLGFDAETLETQYGYGKQAALSIAAFLGNISVEDQSDNTVIADIGTIIERKENPAVLEKSVIEYLEAREETGFNLKSEAGLAVYEKSNRYKASGMSKELLAELIDERKVKPMPTANILTVTPKYRDSGKVVATNRSTPKGMPERIRLNTTVSDSVTEMEKNRITNEPVVLMMNESGTELSMNYKGSDVVPLLIIGEDGEGLSSITELMGLDAEILHRDYGYSHEEAINASEVLESIHVPEGQEAAYQMQVHPEVEDVIHESKGKDVEALRQSILEKLSTREDVVYDLGSARGIESYMTSPMFKQLKMSEVELKQYIAQVQGSNANHAVYARNGIASQTVHRGFDEKEVVRLRSASAQRNVNTTTDSGIDYLTVEQLEDLKLTAQSGDIPSLIIGGQEPQGTSVTSLSNITIETLEREYGYTPQDAQETMKMLNQMQVPTGREDYYREELEQKVKQAVKTSSGNGKLWDSLVKELGPRSDTVYNLSNHAGMNSYMNTESYYSTGMTPSSLTEYVTRMQGSGNVGKSNGRRTKSNLNVPVYVRNNASPVNLAEVVTGTAWNRNTPRQSVPVIMGRSGSEPNITEDVSSMLGFNKSITPSSIPTAAEVAASLSGPISVNGVTKLPDYTVGARAKAREKLGNQLADPETMRLRKIEAEYEKEKAEWEKKKQPVLARSASHELGHAEGSVDEIVNLEKSSKEVGIHLLESLQRRRR